MLREASGCATSYLHPLKDYHLHKHPTFTAYPNGGVPQAIDTCTGLPTHILSIRVCSKKDLHSSASSL